MSSIFTCGHSLGILRCLLKGGCVNPSFAGRANHILWQWGWLCLGYPFLTEWTHTVYLKAEGGGRSITRHMHHAVAPPIAQGRAVLLGFAQPVPECSWKIEQESSFEFF